MGGLHLNDRQCGCSRDIRADLYFSFHGKSRSLGDTHLEESLLGFAHFPVGKRDRAIVSAPWMKGRKEIRISSHGAGEDAGRRGCQESERL